MPTLSPAADLTARIAARIAELEKEQAAYVAQANTQLAAYQAAIGELKRLIEPAAERPEYVEQIEADV